MGQQERRHPRRIGLEGQGQDVKHEFKVLAVGGGDADGSGHGGRVLGVSQFFGLLDAHFQLAHTS